MSNNWEEITDDIGRIYYYNKTTQETSWTKPLDTTCDWKAYTTDDGRQYYHNENTGETTWEIPEGFEESFGNKDKTDAVEHENYESYKEKEKPTSDETKSRSSLDLELEKKSTIRNELIEPPQFKSYQEAEDAFLSLLKSNNVDSTWSFQEVISKFIKNPIYWAIPDALHRRRLYDEYLVQKLKDELTNKSAIVENFEKNFLQVLQNFEKKGLIKYNTRWITIKNILIAEENPIFKNSVLSDNEVLKIYDEFVNALKEAREESIRQQKAQALNELKSYLTQINPILVSDSENWDQLYNNLQNDARFKANKHFTVLNKVDILELYTTDIYPHILGKLKNEITSIEKKNYRSDRKARQSFKELLLRNININANSLFENIFPLLENEDCFIELCGRNGSSPLDFFWDVVDEKYQIMKLKKDLVENTLSGLKNNPKYSYDQLLSSKENFINSLADLKDERLSAFDFKLSNEAQDDNELEIIFDNLKRDYDLKNEMLKTRYKMELEQRKDELAHWLYSNHDKHDIIKFISHESDTSDGYSVAILIKEGLNNPSKYAVNTIDKNALQSLFKSKFQNIEQYRKLETTSQLASNKGIRTSIEDSLEDSINGLVNLLNDNTSVSDEKSAYANRKRQIREDHTDTKRFKPESKETDATVKPDGPKQNPVLLNY